MGAKTLVLAKRKVLCNRLLLSLFLFFCAVTVEKSTASTSRAALDSSEVPFDPRGGGRNYNFRPSASGNPYDRGSHFGKPTSSSPEEIPPKPSTPSPVTNKQTVPTQRPPVENPYRCSSMEECLRYKK